MKYNNNFVFSAMTALSKGSPKSPGL